MVRELNAKLLDRLVALRGRRGALLARRVVAAALLLLAAALAIGQRTAAPDQRADAAPAHEPALVAAPIRLADPDIAKFLRPGRRVDIVTEPAASGEGSVLATDAAVVSAPEAGPGGTGPERGGVLFVKLPEHSAAKVAAKSLTQQVTVTLR
ncbi:hypothetical protein GCM10009854_13430 [Saccharopolyspora halophila]|uniref:SAF domain-containing protein n=1 Tax=Saccharopolyspora halophila TaxID=405551 RepID=A0ABN3FWE2_9PSEU